MPEIEITPEQRDRLRSLQEDLARDVVGKYGHVRPKDAVEYLLDQYDGDEDGAADDDANGEYDGDEDGAADDDANGEPDAADPDGGAVARVVGESPGEDEDEDGNEDEDGDEDESTAASDASTDGAPAEASTTNGTTTSTGEGTETASESATGGDSMLDAMLNLLDTHDDKWSESSAADERYAVELPDGSTEHVRTKDDVKALLFKHYR